MQRDLVLVHGWAMQPRVWDPVVPELENAFRIHNLGLPGYEHADPAAGRYREMSGRVILEQWSDALLSRAPDRALWVGWSLGALVVLDAMLRAPERVPAAVLVAATPRFVRGGDWEAGMEPDDMNEFLAGMRTDDDKTLRRFVLLQADDRRTARTLAGCAAGDGVDRQVLEAGLRVLDEVDLRGDLSGVAAPVRVVHGSRDRIVPRQAGAYVADRLPRGEWLELDAGHAPFVECPDAFIEAVLAWR